MPSTFDDYKKFVIRLSQHDLNFFGIGAVQKPSASSILVNCDRKWYKYPIGDAERLTLSDLIIQDVKGNHAISHRGEKRGRFSALRPTDCR